MHARIGTFDVPPARLDGVLASFRDHAVPAFAQLDGFLGYQAFVDRERGRIVGISFWASRSALEASVTTARSAIGKAADLGAVLVDEPQILELAFDERADR